MNIQIYADGADLTAMAQLALNPIVAGLTTNPTLLRKAGITDYRAFAKEALSVIGGKPVSFEVLADDRAGMERQAQEIASWGENVYVKIPITNTAGESMAETIELLAGIGVKVNVTALMTAKQINAAALALNGADGILSVFAGRIADTGRSPINLVRQAIHLANRQTRVLWASTREVFNVVQADEIGCDIITCSPEIIAKLPGLGADLDAVSLATVKQFFNDAKGLTL